MRALFICFALILTLDAKGQNLVINSSFEDTISLVTWDSLLVTTWPMVTACPPWYVPSSGSPDYFSMYWGGYQYQAVPNNNAGFSYPVTGFAYYGFSVSNGPPYQDNFREYIAEMLNDSMVSGHQYLVSFYVKPAGKCRYFTDDIGACLSVDSIVSIFNTNLLVMPQIENPQGSMLNDTVNWTLISGIYTASGGEKFITIGNFKDDANTTIDSFNIITINTLSYYFIDDVSVIDCTAAGIQDHEAIYLSLQNPVNTTLLFTCNEKITRAVLYNLLGEPVLENHFNQPGNTYGMNVATLPKGMYMLLVESKKGSRGIKKVLKL